MKRGFTLTELLTGLLIAGILAAIAVPHFKQQIVASEGFALIRRHPFAGAKILRPVPTPGNDLSLHARIAGVADVVDGTPVVAPPVAGSRSLIFRV